MLWTLMVFSGLVSLINRSFTLPVYGKDHTITGGQATLVALSVILIGTWGLIVYIGWPTHSPRRVRWFWICLLLTATFSVISLRLVNRFLAVPSVVACILVMCVWAGYLAASDGK